MSVLVHEERISKLKTLDNPTSKELRGRAESGTRSFRTAWMELAQPLYSIWRDKLYEYWGYEKFADYAERELGLKKSMALKLVKTYCFIEQQEPQYLKKETVEATAPASLPEMDAFHVLRLARGKKELTKQDYAEIRRQVVDKGKSAALVRKDLTALIKERKVVDPDEEREKRSIAAIRRILNAIRSFHKDAQTLKLVKADIVQKTEGLAKELEGLL
ncbi:MAG: hypothetical protein GX606_03265 [Elusimicrobia bacterium]|nr:hypothetical protein [Elusimicrobiota bacterium]